MSIHKGTCLCRDCCERFVAAFAKAVVEGTVIRIGNSGREKMHLSVNRLIDDNFGEVELLLPLEAGTKVTPTSMPLG